MPKAVFQHAEEKGIDVGLQLVKHPLTKAVGFTGSYTAGKALFDAANARKEPIPVFAEMGSVNPVFLLPEKLKIEAAKLAESLAASIIQGVGQFCTNPGLVFGIKGNDLDLFIKNLGEAITKQAPAAMLHEGIYKNYEKNRDKALSQNEVKKIAEGSRKPNAGEGLPVVATTSGATFLQNTQLHQEVFGPFSLVIQCDNISEMEAITDKLEGQLTATFMATETELADNKNLLQKVQNICGRIILNGVPTGVEVCLAMQHGGPFPASTDSRFTSVGADGMKRFARPVSFQNWPDVLLPDELKNANPLKIWRTVNNALTNNAL